MWFYLKSRRALLNQSMPTMSARDPAAEPGTRGTGRSSPPYGPTTAMDQSSRFDTNFEQCGNRTGAQNISCCEHDHDKGVITAVDTPCIGVCSTTFDDVCIGCGRTFFEVAQWAVMTVEQKEEVWRRIDSKGYPRLNKQSGVN